MGWEPRPDSPTACLGPTCSTSLPTWKCFISPGPPASHAGPRYSGRKLVRAGPALSAVCLCDTSNKRNVCKYHPTTALPSSTTGLRRQNISSTRERSKKQSLPFTEIKILRQSLYFIHGGTTDSACCTRCKGGGDVFHLQQGGRLNINALGNCRRGQ